MAAYQYTPPVVIPQLPGLEHRSILGGSNPGRTTVAASALIGTWADQAAAMKAEALEHSDGKAATLAANAQQILARLHVDVASGNPEYVFALTTGAGEESIRAIATVTAQNVWDDGLQEKVRVMAIGDLAVEPAADLQEDLGSELVRRITAWAGDTMVTLAPPSTGARRYYTGLGFQLLDTFGPSLVFPRFEKDPSFNSQEYRMAEIADPDYSFR